MKRISRLFLITLLGMISIISVGCREDKNVEMSDMAKKMVERFDYPYTVFILVVNGLCPIFIKKCP